MNKTLKVITPFLHLTPGDTFELDRNGNYVAEHNEEFDRDDTCGDFKSSFSSKFVISKEYAKELVDNDILDDSSQEKPFVNVFDEIDDMLNQYTTDLKNLDNDMKDSPECLKVERTTVLRNLIKTLNYLKDLRK